MLSRSAAGRSRAVSAASRACLCCPGQAGPRADMRAFVRAFVPSAAWSWEVPCVLWKEVLFISSWFCTFSGCLRNYVSCYLMTWSKRNDNSSDNDILDKHSEIKYIYDFHSLLQIHLSSLQCKYQDMMMHTNASTSRVPFSYHKAVISLTDNVPNNSIMSDIYARAYAVSTNCNCFSSEIIKLNLCCFNNTTMKTITDIQVIRFTDRLKDVSMIMSSC